MRILIAAVLAILSLSHGSDAASICAGKTAAQCVQEMTLDEKIGQMTCVAHNYLKSKDHVAKYFLGSLLSGGGGGPDGEGGSATEWADMYDEYQQIAMSTRLEIPLLYGVDAVHGHSNVAGATIFPHNLALGAANDPDLTFRVAEATRKETLATGIDWTYSPVCAVTRDDRWGRTYESFGESSDLVSAHVAQAVKGYQGGSSGVTSRSSIMATAKHFLGDGATIFGTGDSGYLIDQGDVNLSENEIRNSVLPPYESAVVDNKAAAVMISYSSIDGVKMHGNKYWITDVLKGELGFKGIVITDWDGIDMIDPDSLGRSIRTGINAGIDMIMIGNDNYESYIAKLKNEVSNGRISIDRINDAVERIIQAKLNIQVFDYPKADRSFLGTVGSSAHRKIAREAVAKSAVLLKKGAGKDGESFFPLSTAGSYKLAVAGKNAHNLGYQCGGWTYSWQGESNNNGFIPGTTIWKAIKSAISGNANIQATRYSDVTSSTNVDADYGIAVVGEGKPYAEGFGDVENLKLSDADARVVTNLCSKVRIGCVVVVVSGRPLVIKDVLPSAPVWVMAWLPGTEGDGVADVLFGKEPFTGKLPVTWPKSTAQEPTNFDDGTDGNAQFKFGHGLA